MLGFLCASFFHGGVAIGLFAFLFFVGLKNLLRTSILLCRMKISIPTLLISLIAVSVFVSHIISPFSIQKLISFDQLLDIEYITKIIGQTMTGDATLPQWLIPNSWTEILLIAPIRIIYFLCSPLPWEVHKIYHLSGSFDGILYFFLVLLIWRNRKKIWIDPRKKMNEKTV